VAAAQLQQEETQRGLATADHERATATLEEEQMRLRAELKKSQDQYSEELTEWCNKCSLAESDAASTRQFSEKMAAAHAEQLAALQAELAELQAGDQAYTELKAAHEQACTELKAAREHSETMAAAHAELVAAQQSEMDELREEVSRTEQVRALQQQLHAEQAATIQAAQVVATEELQKAQEECSQLRKKCRANEIADLKSGLNPTGSLQPLSGTELGPPSLSVMHTPTMSPQPLTAMPMKPDKKVEVTFIDSPQMEMEQRRHIPRRVPSALSPPLPTADKSEVTPAEKWKQSHGPVNKTEGITGHSKNSSGPGIPQPYAPEIPQESRQEQRDGQSDKQSTLLSYISACALDIATYALFMFMFVWAGHAYLELVRADIDVD